MTFYSNTNLIIYGVLLQTYVKQNKYHINLAYVLMYCDSNDISLFICIYLYFIKYKYYYCKYGFLLLPRTFSSTMIMNICKISS